MNPDVRVTTVLDLLPEVMKVAEHFTTYNDTRDGALFYSHWIQKVIPGWYQTKPRAIGSKVVFGRQVTSMWYERRNGQIRGRLQESRDCERFDESPWSAEQIDGDGS